MAKSRKIEVLRGRKLASRNTRRPSLSQLPGPKGNCYRGCMGRPTQNGAKRKPQCFSGCQTAQDAQRVSFQKLLTIPQVSGTKSQLDVDATPTTLTTNGTHLTMYAGDSVHFHHGDHTRRLRIRTELHDQ